MFLYFIQKFQYSDSYSIFHILVIVWSFFSYGNNQDNCLNMNEKYITGCFFGIAFEEWTGAEMWNENDEFKYYWFKMNGFVLKSRGRNKLDDMRQIN